MNLWDNLPCELQTYILRLRLASSLQKNWRRHPAIRSICLAKWLTDRHNVSPPLLLYAETAWALEYCAAHSGMGDPVFWTKFCILMLHEIILEEYSSDMGHGWKDRCEVAHKTLVKKYLLRTMLLCVSSTFGQ